MGLAEIQHAVAGLSQGFENMRLAFNNNHMAYSAAIGAVDGHIAVIRAVLNDIHLNKIRYDTDGNIDWDVYYTWYNEYQKQKSSEESEAKETAAKESGSEAGVIVDPTNQDLGEEIFGGDYGSGIRQVHEGKSQETG